MLIKSGTSWTKYRFEQHNQSLGTFKSLNVADNITLGGTVDGHDIDSELNTLNGRVNQGVKTTDSPTFASVNTGHGANEVYAMNQNLRTTDNVSFANMNPPVDNNDASLPSIGKGGFTYGTFSSTITLPTGGTYITIAITRIGSVSEDMTGRFSGGLTLTNGEAESGGIFVWRIA
jgi:hypothetical protein